MDQDRRGVLRLAGLALAAGVAGCSGPDEGDAPDTATGDGPTDAPTGSPTPPAWTGETQSTPEDTATPEETPAETATATPTETATPRPDTTVSIRDFQFAPRVQGVGVGATVAWRNDGQSPHTVESAQFNDGAAEWEFSSPTLRRNDTVQYTFQERGAYEFFCTVHGESSMCGVVLVGGAAKPGPLPCEDAY
ncbi:MAG: plastocyanin/azurin family copper-binding protein [Halorientalis sp.]